MTQLFALANLVTASRLILFAAFLYYLYEGRLQLAIGFFALSWALDGIDGWIARSRGTAGTFGSQLDKVVDRTIIVLGILAFILGGFIPRAAVLLLTKDIALIPVLGMALVKREPMRGAGVAGKAMTFLQGAGVLWLLLGWPQPMVVIGLVAGLGAVVGFFHLHKVAYE